MSLDQCLKFLQIALLSAAISACPRGWHPSLMNPTQCYSVPQERMSWHHAEEHCRTVSPNGHLISILSAFETNEISEIAGNNPEIGSLDQVWIGAIGINGDEIFTWTDGNFFQYTHWLSGQPNLLYPCVSTLARERGPWRTEPCETKNYFMCKYTMKPTAAPTDCADWIFNNGNSTSGIYPIYPPGRPSLNVYCDMTTDGGGWTVFQRRPDGNLLFHNRTWDEYKNGFNNGLENSLWLGNDILHVLSTKDPNVELRVDIWGDRSPNAKNPNIYMFAKYDHFSVDSEENNYVLHVGHSTGNATAGENPFSSLHFNDGKNFSTIDVHHDSCEYGCIGCCSTKFNYGGWWLCSCTLVSLNGGYIPIGWPYTNYYGMTWTTRGNNELFNPAQSRMMLRKNYL